MTKNVQMWINERCAIKSIATMPTIEICFDFFKWWLNFVMIKLCAHATVAFVSISVSNFDQLLISRWITSDAFLPTRIQIFYFYFFFCFVKWMISQNICVWFCIFFFLVWNLSFHTWLVCVLSIWILFSFILQLLFKTEIIFVPLHILYVLSVALLYRLNSHFNLTIILEFRLIISFEFTQFYWTNLILFVDRLKSSVSSV